MNRFTKMLVGIAVLGGAIVGLGTPAANAAVILEGWNLNLSNAGTGTFNPAPSNATDISLVNFSNGASVILQNLAAGSALGQAFTENGVIQTTNFTQVGSLGSTPYNLGAATTLYFTYTLSGTVSLTGNLQFSSGSATMILSNSNTLDPTKGTNQTLATFAVIPGTGGTGLISAGGIPSGTIQITFKENAGGVANLFTIGGTNLQNIALELANIQPVLDQSPNGTGDSNNSFLGALGGTCTSATNPAPGPGANQETVCVTEQGQLVLTVPEPSSLLVLGAGLLVLGFVGRRHAKKERLQA